MIAGLGIDITEIDRVQVAVKKTPRFVAKVLTPGEQAQLAKLNGRRVAEYIAGRFSVKEAFAKAMGTGIGRAFSFQDVEIIDNQHGKPVATRSPFVGRVHVSISHTATLVMTEVILETEDEDDKRNPSTN